LPNLLVVAEIRDNFTKCCALGNQPTIRHQIADNNFRKKIAMPGGARVISLPDYA
jgi:hypothetical protein